MGRNSAGVRETPPLSTEIKRDLNRTLNEMVNVASDYRRERPSEYETQVYNMTKAYHKSLDKDIDDFETKLVKSVTAVVRDPSNRNVSRLEALKKQVEDKKVLSPRTQAMGAKLYKEANKYDQETRERIQASTGHDHSLFHSNLFMENLNKAIKGLRRK